MADSKGNGERVFSSMKEVERAYFQALSEDRKEAQMLIDETAHITQSALKKHVKRIASEGQ